MATFCLVHGSTQSASGWERLVAELDRRGHRTIVPTLAADEPDASASRYADQIVHVLPADASDVIVVAHSASGLFLPLVPPRRKVRQIVFLAAVIPKIGASLAEQFQTEPGMLNPEWIGKDPTASDEDRHAFPVSRLHAGDCTVGVDDDAVDARTARVRGGLSAGSVARRSGGVRRVRGRSDGETGLVDGRRPRARWRRADRPAWRALPARFASERSRGDARRHCGRRRAGSGRSAGLIAGPSYSARNATIGSTRMARNAGIAHAATATASSSAEIAA